MPVINKTDNHFLRDKIQLRIERSPWPTDRPLRVLDAFGGKGRVWAGVTRLSGKVVERTAIDYRDDVSDFHLHGDNTKVMAGLDLACFDCIDLDGYGIPCDPLFECLRQGYVGTVFVTFIQNVHGRLPNRLLAAMGFNASQLATAGTLCSKRGWQYFLQWLAWQGVTRVWHRSKARKHYLAFALGAARPAAADG